MRFRFARFAVACCLVAGQGAVSPAPAQTFTSRGFVDGRLFFYPQSAPDDPTNVVGEALIRYEPSWRPESWLRVNAALDARIDTHRQVERRWVLDWQDRGIERPPFSIRRLSAMLSHGALTVEVGKQFIRWGKADVLNPTDRFTPRDFLSVVDNDFLGVTGARLTYESGGNTVDAVWVPRFTPSRIPLFDQRWAAFPPVAAAVPVSDAGSRLPGGSQAGVRWNRSGPGYEFSLSVYNGFNHLPIVDVSILPAPLRVQLTRVFPQMRMYGGDCALPNRWVTLKGEIGYFTSSTQLADEYGIYVLQLERQAGEWSFVGGYAGDFTTRNAVRPVPSPIPELPPSTIVPFAAERGLARAFVGRASSTVDANSSVVLQAAVRRNGDGAWLQAQYSRARGSHLRATLEGNVIRGIDADFLGQFRRNSNVNLALRYSF
jgi:hypothetical protein